MTERWKPVVGFEGYYEVSDQGRVRSLDRLDAQGRDWPGRVMSLGKTRGDYLTVHLCLHAVRSNPRVNRLVAEAFLGPAPTPQHEAAHLNGVRSDNHAGNLKWKTKVENHEDKVRHGTALTGEACPWATLTRGMVLDIREAASRGEDYASIARRLRRSYSAVYGAGTGRRWNSL